MSKVQKPKNFKHKVNKSRVATQRTRKEVISIHQFSKIAMTFWIGGSLMSALVVFPILFKNLDPVTASDVVGQLLNLLAYIGIVCLLIALVEVIINHKLALIKTRRFWYIISMDSILIINYFAIFPMVYKIRQHISEVAHQILSVQTSVFDFWHSLSAVTFILSCLLGLFYLIEM